MQLNLEKLKQKINHRKLKQKIKFEIKKIIKIEIITQYQTKN